jgi:hypothetical protein
VQAAARATLATGSARIRTLFGQSFDPPVIEFGSEGVADLALRRSVRENRSTKIDELARKAAERFPGLDDDHEPGDEPEEPYLTYEEGTTVIHGVAGHWHRHDGDQRSWRDPTLALDLLAAHPLDDARLEVDEPVRGARCARYGGKLDQRRFDEALGSDPSETPDRTLHVKAWVDPEGRLTRASWVFAQVGRPRSPLRPKHPPAWRTVELWDFGLPVDIRMPDVAPRPPSEDDDAPSAFTVAADLAGVLWRARRRRR